MTTEFTLRDVLASQFDEYSVRGRLRTSDRNTVYEVSVDGRRAACKLTDGQPATLAREGAVLEAVAEQTSVPVPEVFATGDGYLVLEWARGEHYEDGTGNRRRERLCAIGRTLARLHEATDSWLDGHGALERGGGPLAVERPTGWPDRFTAFVDDWATDLAGTRDADAARAVAELVHDNCHAFADCPPVLVHGEPCPEHVRFDGHEVVALFDWEIAQAAPGEFDLVWAERDFLRTPFDGELDGDLLTALHEGYEAERPSSPGSTFRREVYRAAFAMRDLKHVDDGETAAGTDDGDRKTAIRRFVFDRLDAAETMGI